MNKIEKNVVYRRIQYTRHVYYCLPLQVNWTYFPSHYSRCLISIFCLSLSLFISLSVLFLVVSPTKNSSQTIRGTRQTLMSDTNEQIQKIHFYTQEWVCVWRQSRMNMAMDVIKFFVFSLFYIVCFTLLFYAL